MPSLLRLLFPNPGVKPRNVQRDIVALALDDGDSIEVLRVRDPRARRLRLSVDERGARLTLPPRASLVSGQRFLREHREWLAEQVRAHAIDGLEPLVPGTTTHLPLRGSEIALRWEPGRYARLERAGDLVLFRHPPGARQPVLVRALRDFYEGESRADLGRWLPAYLPTLPRAPSRMRFRSMSSQWGSLAPDDALSLDLALVLARPSAFEYVVVHELCHLIHADHSQRFWAEVEARCPCWREEREYFRREGRRLKACLRTLLSPESDAAA